MKLHHYLFEETVSGERFIVGAFTFVGAKAYAAEICDDISLNNQFNDYESEWEWECTFISELTDEEAEASGFDEY